MTCRMTWLLASLVVAVSLSGCTEHGVPLGHDVGEFSIQDLDGHPVTDDFMEGHVSMLHLYHPNRSNYELNSTMELARAFHNATRGLPIRFLTVGWIDHGPDDNNAVSEQELKRMLREARPADPGNWVFSVNNGSKPLDPAYHGMGNYIYLVDKDGTLRVSAVGRIYRAPCLVQAARDMVNGTFEGRLGC